ncbi:potassium channel family protein [Roseivirga sp.]|uniref:potassium channel family protein n=1 Tax=Roseivirga sp. TaxID=1964215 RepID=UPI002B27890E|nr:potassium channel family protein [Roseivirga sp.]
MTKTTRTWAICIVLCLLSLPKLAAQEIQLKEYSFSEFFQMIDQEEDSVFRLSNAFLKFNKETDQKFKLTFEFDKPFNLTSANKDSIRIDKALELTNIVIESYATSNSGGLFGIGKVVFSKPIQCTNCINFMVAQSTFNSTVTFRFNRQIQDFESLLPDFPAPSLYICSSNFQSGLVISSANFQNGFETNTVTDKRSLELTLFENVISAHKEKNEKITILGAVFQKLLFNKNIIGGSAHLTISSEPANTQNQNNERLFNLSINDNEFNVPITKLDFNDQNTDFVTMKGNQWSGAIIASINQLDRVNTLIDGSGLSEKLIDDGTYMEYIFPRIDEGQFRQDDFYSKKDLDHYRQKQMIEDVNFYNSEVALRGLFKNYFDSRHDAVSANQFYIEIKDLETRRLAYLYHQNPSFDGFFKWRINQFLKIFSAYGTEPAKAITFSVYVILAFALVYLFFPNYWDSHGKNRIKDRFLFFHKYLRHNKGIHDVYLEDRQLELQSSLAFQQVLDEHKDEVPSFFYKAAKPLYRWSVASTTLYAKLLRQVDFLKGSWKETDPKVRGFRTALTITIFIIALIYDIFIKMLNALMLSINTFTTLGFGEIPIKGLPRYLAIIQGFIGWFMLTIFSVSLISQLLN